MFAAPAAFLFRPARHAAKMIGLDALRKIVMHQHLIGIPVVLLLAAPLHAVILYSKPERNTDPPDGALLNSGWQYQGQFRGFLATPISKKYFITAGHIGGVVGNKLKVGDRVFTTTTYWDDPNSDLRIWTVNKKFSAWAPLYTGTKEVGKHAMIFGRGTQRGAEIRDNSNTTLKGWEWGIADTVQSWGINQIDAIIPGNSDEGDLLQFDFDANGVSNEATLSNGDSAGGVFFYDKPAATWKLAGINYSVDGPFKRTADGSEFHAALFDLGGFYYGSTFIADQFIDIPQKFYATRISSNMPWIMGVLNGTVPPTQTAPPAGRPAGVPEPTALFGVATATVLSRRQRRRP